MPDPFMFPAPRDANIGTSCVHRSSDHLRQQVGIKIDASVRMTGMRKSHKRDPV